MNDESAKLRALLADYLRRKYGQILGQEIEDVAQQTMLGLITGPSQNVKLDTPQGLKLAYYTAKFRAIDLIRKRYRTRLEQFEPERLEGEGQRSVTPLIESSRSEAIHALNAALVNDLADFERHIIKLRFYDGCTLEEIAQRLGRSTASIHRGLFNALNKLRRGMRGFEDILSDD